MTFTYIKKHQTLLVFLMLAILSASSFYYYFSTGLNILEGDADSRLNITRGIIDNLKPGFGQLSNVWLPLPTFFMLPFIWNNYLWHSGIAGAIISMSSYIIGGVYLFKSCKIITGAFFASFCATLVYALNINLLYLQTTAMSEPIFLCSIIITVYHFLVWIKDYRKITNLIFAGIAVTAASLIRYEGWAVMFASIPMVAIILWFRTHNYKVTEGRTVLYSTMAAFGFVIWAIFLTYLYGNPFYWKEVYLTQTVVTTAKGQIKTYSFNLTALQAAWTYFSAMVWMNGLVPTIMAFCILPFLSVYSVIKKNYYLLPILLLLSIYLFMILTLERNTPIMEPALTIYNLLSSKTQNIVEYNIRYGITMLPFVALLTAYVFNIRSYFFRVIFVYLFAFQIFSYFIPAYSIIYQIPVGNNIEMVPKKNNMVSWFHGHYDGGLIMISSLFYNSDILEFGYNLKSFVFEGTGNYWTTSLVAPQKYVSWIVFNTNNHQDKVVASLYRSPVLKKYYTLEYNKNGWKVYKINNYHTLALR